MVELSPEERRVVSSILTRGTMDLLSKRCIPCEGGAKPFLRSEAEKYLKKTPGWRLLPAGLEIEREFKFEDFKEAMGFVNKVAELAESEGHHPDIHVFYNRVKLALSTHAIGGLSENDFIVAAKINRFFSRAIS